MFGLFKKQNKEQENKKAKNSCCKIEFEEMPEELIEKSDKKSASGKKSCCR